MKHLPLTKDISIPIVGLGTWQLKGTQCRTAVASAITIGYRHIDTADVYDNHDAVAKGIEDSGIQREDLFITTKVWRDDLHAHDVKKSTHRFLKELHVGYIDLLLIHWPNTAIPISETLFAMQQLKEEGLIKAIGVSNFTIPLLTDALHTGVEIVTNQVEFHPSLYQKELYTFCKNHKVHITAYSPIAQGHDLSLPLIRELAEKYQCPPSHVILSWLMEKDIIVIPRSTNTKRLEENFAATTLQLKKGDIESIDQIGGNHRIVAPSFAPFDK